MKAIIALILVATSAFVVADTEASFTLPSGVNVKITETPFQKKLFKVLGCSDSNTACLINGHVPVGSASELPKTYVKRISAIYQGQSYMLNVSDMYNAWGKRPLEVEGAVRYLGGKCTDAKNC